VDDLTIGKTYEVIQIRDFPEKDICIKSNDGYNWWFGQVGSSQPWTMFFITETEFIRNQKIEKLIS
jgi:hypothetical protein